MIASRMFKKAKRAVVIVALLHIVTGIVFADSLVSTVFAPDAIAAVSYCDRTARVGDSCPVDGGGMGMCGGTGIPLTCFGTPTGPDAPEMPAAMVPAFLLITASSFWALRRRMLRQHVNARR